MKTYVSYAQFGAKGDGKTDDMPAIVRAHEYANEHGLPVRAEAKANYYIGGKNLTAVIKTDTDWGTAKFTLDDRCLENINQSIFSVPTAYEAKPIFLDRLKRRQEKLDLSFEGESFIFVKDETKKIFRRKGVNRSDGVPQSDCFLVRCDGTVLNGINWDFEHITSATARRIDETPLVLSGGFFETIANEGESKYNYHDRNIRIKRSHVTVRNLTHRVIGEGEHGAPYGGFLLGSDCAYLTLRDCSLCGHKLYYTPGYGGMSPMGSYDINLGGCAFVTLSNVTQITDIMDKTRWGLIGTNFCKDIVFKNCVISRFDAHMGVNGAKIIGSSIGWQRLCTIGIGQFFVEATSLYGSSMISLRYDYGSHWDGNMTICRCRWYSTGKHPSVIAAANDGDHDFGYECKMPKTIVIDDLLIDDTGNTEAEDICLLGNYCEDPESEKPFPYRIPEKLIVRGVRTVSGRKVLLCRDERFYKGMQVDWKD